MVVLITTSLYTKLETSSFIRYKDKTVDPKFINVSRDLDHAHLRNN